MMHGLKALPAVERLSERVIRILGCNPGPMTLQGTNTYLLGRGRERILVDTGEAKNVEYLQTLRRVVVEEEHSLLRHIVITHWHHDHIGGVDGVISALSEVQAVDADTRVWKYPLVSDHPQNSCEDASAPQSAPASVHANVLEQSGKTLHAVAEAGFLPVPSMRKISPLNDDAELSVDEGNTTVRVLYTPGHTQDHVALLLKEENTLLSGDCVLGSDSTAVFENLRQYMASLNKLMHTNPHRIYPGHGAVVDDAEAKLRHYIQHRQNREKQISQFLADESPRRRGVTLIEITQAIYKDLPNPALLPAAAINVRHHLEKLAEDGVIKVSSTDGNETSYAIVGESDNR